MVTCSLRFFLSHEDDLPYNKVATQLNTYAGAYYDASNVVNVYEDSTKRPKQS